MDEINIPELRSVVLWAMFAISFAFGAISQRSHFCTMGAVSDIVNFQDWGRMRQWAIAIALSALALQGMAISGQANLNDTIFVSGLWSWASALLGGLLFGFGMVMASGCGSKTLIRLGAGNLKALYVFLLLALSGWMTLKGIVAVPRVQWLDTFRVQIGPSAHLPTLLAGGSAQVSHLLAIGIPLALLVWALSNRSAWQKDTLLGGVGIGLCVAAAWVLVFQWAYLPEHPDTLEAAYIATYTNRAEALSFVAPSAYLLEWLTFFSDSSRVLTTAVVSVLGMVSGAAVMAIVGKEFRWEAFTQVEDMANHTIGAVLMGIGGVLAMGCTVGQGLSGVSTLSLTSMLTLLAILAGAVAAIKYQMWRLERMA